VQKSNKDGTAIKNIDTNFKAGLRIQHTIHLKTLVGWCLTALSAQKGYIMPCKK